MLRTTATRSLLKTFAKVPTSRSSYSAASASFRNASPLRQLSNKRPQVLASIPLASTRRGPVLFATNKAGPPYDKVDAEAEAKIGDKVLKPDPEHVSVGSSSIPVLEGRPKSSGDDTEMLGAIKADLVTIKETFSLNEVPRESLYIGAAGVIPYAATSLSTVYLSYDINHAHATGSGLLISPETAHQLLDWITPIQIGYGAVVSNHINHDRLFQYS
jgi:hypothetical protein